MIGAAPASAIGGQHSPNSRDYRRDERLAAAIAALQFLSTKLQPPPWSKPRDVDTWKSVSLDLDVECGFWCPRAPLRGRKSYKAGIRMGDSAELCSPAESCEKKRSGHPSLMPGVFSVWCPHGVCLAFHMMRVPESPETAFSVLALRREVAPSVVIYDDACNCSCTASRASPSFSLACVFFVIGSTGDHAACGDGLSTSTRFRHRTTTSTPKPLNRDGRKPTSSSRRHSL